jgi:hypothetical protein
MGISVEIFHIYNLFNVKYFTFVSLNCLEPED